MEMQQLFSFALLSSNAIFCTATSTINVLTSSRKLCDIFVQFEFIGASRKIYMKAPNIKFHENPSNESRADTCEKTDERREMVKFTGTFREFSNKTLETYLNLFILHRALFFFKLFNHTHTTKSNLLNVPFCIKPLKTKSRTLYLKTQSVPRCKHFSSRF
jgi:hypothetical protein